MAKLVSKTYGDALFEVAREKNQLDEFLEEVKAVLTAVQENNELIKLISHPKIAKEEKIQIVTDIFSGKVSDELVGLLRMIVDKGHFEEVEGVLTYFIDVVKEFKNIGTAYVTSAIALSDAQKVAVEKRLLETTKYIKFEMHFDVDAALIGGMKIRIGDRVIDSSIQNKISDLTRELTKIQLKVGECAP